MSNEHQPRAGAPPKGTGSSGPALKVADATVWGAVAVFDQACLALSLRLGGRDYDFAALPRSDQYLVLGAAVLLVRVVDLAYVEGDRRAAIAAVHLDNFAGLLRDREKVQRLLRHALHADTRAAIEEARLVAERKPHQPDPCPTPLTAALTAVRRTGRRTAPPFARLWRGMGMALKRPRSPRHAPD